MRRVRCSLLITVLLCTGVAAKADDISKREKVEAMFTVLHLDQTFAQLQSAALAQGQQFGKGLFPQAEKPSPAQQKLFDSFNSDVTALVTNSISWEKMKPAFVELYFSTYSEDDLDGILAFYNSRAGQAVLAKTPELATKSQAIALATMTDLQPKMRALLESFAAKAAGLKKAEAAQ